MTSCYFSEAKHSSTITTFYGSARGSTMNKNPLANNLQSTLCGVRLLRRGSLEHMAFNKG